MITDGQNVLFISRIADDILSFITVYGARLYGKRGGEGRKRERENKQQKSKDKVGPNTNSSTNIKHRRNAQKDDPVQTTSAT